MPARRPATPLARLFDQIEEVVACIALASVVLSVTWGVITRYITAQPAAWASEVATLSFAWLVFFGAAACFKYRLHPAIDMLVARLPYELRKLVRGFNHVLILAFCGFMVWFGTRFAIDAWGSPSAVLRLPLTWLYGPVAFCFALMAVRHIQVLRGREWDIAGERETHVG